MQSHLTSWFLAFIGAFSLALATPIHAADSAEAASPPELLAQYDFEKIPAWIPNWGAGYESTYKPATGWHSPFKVRLDNENPHSGDNALCFEQFEVATGEIIVHSPSIALPELVAGESRSGARVIIRAYVRTQGIMEGDAALRVLEKSKDGKSLGLLKNEKSLVPISESPEWTELTVEGKLRNDTHTIAFMLVANVQQVPAFVCLDDISIEFVK